MALLAPIQVSFLIDVADASEFKMTDAMYKLLAIMTQTGQFRNADQAEIDAFDKEFDIMEGISQVSGTENKT